QESARAGFLLEIHVVETGIGCRELREFAALFPVETARIDQHAADRDTVAAEELGGGVIQEVRAQLEGLHQPGRGEGRIHQQRQAGLVRDFRDFRNIEDVQARIAQRFAEQQTRIWLYRL